MRGIGQASASCWATAKCCCAAGGMVVVAELLASCVAPTRDVAVMVKGALLTAFGKCGDIDRPESENRSKAKAFRDRAINSKLTEIADQII